MPTKAKTAIAPIRSLLRLAGPFAFTKKKEKSLREKRLIAEKLNGFD